MKIRIYPKSLLETMWQQDKLLFTPEAAHNHPCVFGVVSRWTAGWSSTP